MKCAYSDRKTGIHFHQDLADRFLSDRTGADDEIHRREMAAVWPDHRRPRGVGTLFPSPTGEGAEAQTSRLNDAVPVRKGRRSRTST